MSIKYRYNATTNGVSVSIIPHYIPERSAPEHNQFFYGYKVQIENFTYQTIRLIHRHFKIKNGESVFEVQGSGVMGNQPVIEPGQLYEYDAFCPLKSPHGNMRGKFQFITLEGERFFADVPLFFFRPPTE